MKRGAQHLYEVAEWVPEDYLKIFVKNA